MRQDKPEEKLEGIEKEMEAALKALAILLQELNGEADVSVSIHLWKPAIRDIWMVGVRVAEISFTKGNGGGSLMQCDPQFADLLFAAERFLITYHVKPFRPEGWESDIDEHVEAREAVVIIWNKGYRKNV